MLQRYDFAFSFDRSKPDETDKTAVETDKRSVETDGSIIYTVFDACIMNVDCQNQGMILVICRKVTHQEAWLNCPKMCIFEKSIYNDISEAILAVL